RDAPARRASRTARAGAGDGRQLQADVGNVRVVGRGEERTSVVTDLQVALVGRIAPPIANVDDRQFILGDPVIDKVGISRDWEYPNLWNIGLSPKAGKPCEQSTRGTNPPHDGGSSIHIVLRDVLVNVGYVAVGARRIPQPH